MLISRKAKAWLKVAEVEFVVLPRAKYAPSQRTAIAVWQQFLKEASGRDPVIGRLS
jgi:hypothetical protein